MYQFPNKSQSSRLEIRQDESFQRQVIGNAGGETSDTESILIDANIAWEFFSLFEAEDKKRSKTAIVKFSPQTEHEERAMHRFSYSNKLKQELGTLTYFQHQKLRIPKSLMSILNSKYRCPQLDTSDVLNRMYGAFFGFIIGDSVGSYLAFHIHKIDQLVVKSLVMNGGGTYNTNPGQGTDDTQLAFSLAYGLVQGNGVYQPDLVAKQYALWLKSKPFDMSALILIALKQTRNLQLQEDCNSHDVSGLSQIIKKTALRNGNQQSSIGLIRLVPLAIWTINLSEPEIETVIRLQMQHLNPNRLVVETAIVFVRTLHILFIKGDHQEAFYAASKWIYQNGSPQLLNLWKCVEKNTIIPSKGCLGRLKTSFSYSFIQINQPQVNFVETLVEVLRKGGDTDTNAAIVCSMMGAAVGYNQIPSYFRHKIVTSQVSTGHKPRPEKYRPGNVVGLVDKLYRSAPYRLNLQR